MGIKGPDLRIPSHLTFRRQPSNMDYILPGTVEETSEEISLFEGPVTEIGLGSCEYQEYRPVSQITHGSPITFSLNSTEYIDLNKTRLNLKVRIVKENGEAIAIADKVGFVNLVFHSLFRTVDVNLQHTATTTDVGTNYPYKAMMDTLLDEVTGSLEAQMFYKDTYAFMDSTQVNTGQNGGLTDRWSRTMHGSSVELEGPIHADILKQDRLLLNGVRLDVVLHTQSDAFCLMVDGDAKYKVHLMDATLKVCCNKISSGTLAAHAKMLETKNALYPYTHSTVKVYNIPKGSYTWTMDDLFQDKIPSKVVIGMVPEQAYSGSTSRNPFNFQNWDVNYISFLVNGHSRPGQPFQPDYDNNMYMTPYVAMAKKYRDDGTRVKHFEFASGYCLYVFQVEDNTSIIKKGNTRVVLKMSKPLPESVSIIVYGHFPGMMEIDKTRMATLHV